MEHSSGIQGDLEELRERERERDAWWHICKLETTEIYGFSFLCSHVHEHVGLDTHLGWLVYRCGPIPFNQWHHTALHLAATYLVLREANRRPTLAHLLECVWRERRMVKQWSLCFKSMWINPPSMILTRERQEAKSSRFINFLFFAKRLNRMVSAFWDRL